MSIQAFSKTSSASSCIFSCKIHRALSEQEKTWWYGSQFAQLKFSRGQLQQSCFLGAFASLQSHRYHPEKRNATQSLTMPGQDSHIRHIQTSKAEHLVFFWRSHPKEFKPERPKSHSILPHFGGFQEASRITVLCVSCGQSTH